MRFSKATLAIALLTGSKHEIVIVPGVSSTIISTPVSLSKAFMFLPSFPIIFPFSSSEGMFTEVVKISGLTEFAKR